MELKVRYNKGHIASPTSTAGHVVHLLVMAGFAAVWALAYRTTAKDFWVICGMILLGVSLPIVRDAVAWLRAPLSTREAFRAEVEGVRAARMQWSGR